MGGAHTAEVVGGLPGQEVHLDQYGRVRVQFPWDRDNGQAGTWVRVAQVWAGNGWGAMFWPRVGHEVVVIFEGGDPDRPLIVGSVYNSKNMPPYALPLGAYTAGFKSCSQMGNPMLNYNHILLQDDMAKEHIWIHAENKLLTEQENDQTIKHPRTVVTFHGA